MTAVNAGIRLTLTAAMLWALLSLAWMHTRDTAHATDELGPVGSGIFLVLTESTEIPDPPEAHAADVPTTTEPAPTSGAAETTPLTTPATTPPPLQAPPAVATPTGAPPSNAATATACSRCASP